MLQADNVRNQLKRTMERHDLDLVSTDFNDKRYYINIRMAVTTGYFMQVGHREGEKGSYVTRDGQIVGLHPSCGLDNNPEWVVYNEFVLTTRNFIRTCTEVKPEWYVASVAPASPSDPDRRRLLDFAPAYYNLKEMADGETKRALQRVLMKREGKLGAGGAKPDKRQKKRQKREGGA